MADANNQAIRKGGFPPVITLSPTNLTVVATRNAAFQVTATGTGPLRYQWQFNHGILTVATNAMLTLTNVNAGNAGNYDVVVANAYGALTSSVVALTVLVPPGITAQPASLTAIATSNVIFNVSATGPRLSYFWRKDGGFLPAATNVSLILSNVTRAASGTYSVIVTNSSGSVTSAPALLRVLVAQRVEGGTNLHRLPDGRFQLHFHDPDGTLASDLTRLEIHSTTNFIGPATVWVTNTTGLSIINGLILFEDTGSTNLIRRFYRVIEK